MWVVLLSRAIFLSSSHPIFLFIRFPPVECVWKNSRENTIWTFNFFLKRDCVKMLKTRKNGKSVVWWRWGSIDVDVCGKRFNLHTLTFVNLYVRKIIKLNNIFYSVFHVQPSIPLFSDFYPIFSEYFFIHFCMKMCSSGLRNNERWHFDMISRKFLLLLSKDEREIAEFIIFFFLRSCKTKWKPYWNVLLKVSRKFLIKGGIYSDSVKMTKIFILSAIFVIFPNFSIILTFLWLF